MDPSLKQRLLGAAVLVALAIIFVPMLLSGPDPARQAQSVDVPIPPAPEPEFERRSLAVQLPEPRPASPVPPADSNTLPTVDTATAPPATVRPAPAAEDTPVTVAQAPPADNTPAAPAATPPAPAPAPASAGRAANVSYYIPAGVYARAGNADELVARLRKAGYPAASTATQWQGQAARRVSVGPFDNRAAAEAARLKLKDGERDLAVGNVQQQATDASGDAAAADLPADRAGGWAVQLGAFGSHADADKVRKRAVDAGFPAFIDQVNVDGKSLWRVRVGPHAERALADSARVAVRERLKIDGLVVSQR